MRLKCDQWRNGGHAARSTDRQCAGRGSHRAVPCEGRRDGMQRCVGKKAAMQYT